MQEALDLQAEWEQALKQITRGREFDELEAAEQEKFIEISNIYNQRIERKMEELYPSLKNSKRPNEFLWNDLNDGI